MIKIIYVCDQCGNHGEAGEVFWSRDSNTLDPWMRVDSRTRYRVHACSKECAVDLNMQQRAAAGKDKESVNGG